MNDWQWRQVRTRNDAETYIQILQYDARVLGRTEYPNVDAENVLAVAGDQARGYRYWIGQSRSSGVKVCYLIRVLPADQGSPERNRPTVMQIGAMPGHDGVGWQRVYARAVGIVCDHVRATASQLRASSKWNDDWFRVIGIDRQRGRLLATELKKQRSVRDARDTVDRFIVEARRGQ